MAASNSASTTRASWGSYLGNGALESRDLSPADVSLDGPDGQGSRAGGDSPRPGHSQQSTTANFVPQQDPLGTACRHPLGNEQCLFHSRNGTVSPPCIGCPGSDYSPANDSASMPDSPGRSRSLPLALETYTQDYQRHERIANGISSGEPGGNEASHEQLEDQASTVSLDNELLRPGYRVNSRGPTPHLGYGDIREIGAWCPPCPRRDTLP